MEKCFDCAKVNAFIFTEGGTNAGLGHLTRCIALYDELESRDLNVMFVVSGDDTVRTVLRDRKFKLDYWYNNWPNYLHDDCKGKTDCIIDSYIASEKTYFDIQKHCRKALYIDDTNRIDYPRGIIVNPSIFGNQVFYHEQEGQVCLKGIDYIILRKEFQNDFQRIVREEINNILVILGGSDVKNLTPLIITALGDNKYQNINKHIVVGNAFTNIDELKKISEKYSNVHLHINLTANELYQLMEKNDLAITAAGQTVYELLSMRLPFICIKIIENQENNIIGLLQYGMIEDYLDYCKITDRQSVYEYIANNLERYQPKAIRENRAKSMEQFNIGKGARHIIDALVGKNGNEC